MTEPVPSDFELSATEQALSPAELCTVVDGLADRLTLADLGQEDVQLQALGEIVSTGAWETIASLRDDLAGARVMAASLTRLERATGGRLWVQQLMTSALNVATARGSRGQIKAASYERSRLLESVAGVDQELSDVFQNDSRFRYRNHDDRGRLLAPDAPGGGIDVAVWTETMSRFVQNAFLLDGEAARLGLGKRTRTIYEQCGIVNLDRYDYWQLERMARFAEGDSELLDYLRNSDVTVVISEVADYNDALRSHVEAFEDGRQTTLYFEAGHPAGIYRALAKLRKAGVQASTLVLSSHTGPGRLGFGNGNYDLDIVMGRPATEEDLAAEAVGATDVFNVHDLELAQVGRVAKEYMRQDSVTGERQIVLAGCLHGLTHKDLLYSLPVAVASMTDPADKVVVCAADEQVFARRVEDLGPYHDKVRFATTRADGQEEDVPVYVYRHLHNGEIAIEELESVPGTR